MDINRWRLEFAAYAQSIDLIFIELCQVGIPAKFDCSAVRPGASGDQIQHGALAGPVGADDDAQFALVHTQGQFGNGLESVKSLVDIFQVQDQLFAGLAHGTSSVSIFARRTGAGWGWRRQRRARSSNCRGKPTIPLGMNTVTT